MGENGTGKSALLVIDLQRGLIAGSAAAHAAETVLANVAGLVERARAEGVPVIHVQHDGGKGDELERGTAGWEIHPAVAPQGEEPVFEKDRCSAFDLTAIDEALRARGIDRLVIAGMQTEYCIDTNCRAAHARGYELVLVKDGHTTFDNGVVSGEQIVAHHNRTLAGGGFVTLAPAASVKF